jgi:signal transduction histidine kinase
MFSLPSAAPWRSIRWTLPLLIVSLLLLVVATLDVVARSQLRRVVLDATDDRLGGVTAQLAALLGESVNRVGAELAAAAADPAAAAYLQRRRPDDSARALRALRDRAWSGTTPPLVTELRTRAGERALRVGDASINDDVPRGVGPFRQSGTLLYIARGVPVVASGDTVGWLVQHRVVTGQGVAAVRALIGSDADILVGNADATLWTDLGKVVPGPPASALSSDALTMYVLPNGVSKVGMGRAIPGTPWKVWTELPTQVVMAPVQRFLRRLAVVSVIVITAGALGGWLLGRRLTRPLEERTHQLAEALTQLRTAQDQLVKREKLAMLGQLAAGVGHELRNPLGVMTNAVHYLTAVLRDRPAVVDDYLGILRAQIGLAERIVGDLLDFARVRDPHRERIALDRVVAEQIERMGPLNGIVVDEQWAPGLPPVFADRVQLGQIILNLVANAVQAMGDQGTLTVRGLAGADGRVRLEVSDTGNGIADEHRDRIFEPLFTTKARGLGLGLAVSKALAEANRVEIQVESVAGKGSTFILVLPTTGDSA